MDKWYKHSYINRANWILENYANLNLSCEEGILVLLINHANESHMALSQDSLAALSGMSIAQVDKAIALLCAKQYLTIRAAITGIEFDLNGLFEAETAKSEKASSQSLFDVFESEFARPLTQNEMMKISDWSKQFDQRMVLYALKEAALYKKVSIPYIAAILEEWRKRGYTVGMIEKGKHVEY